MFKQFFYLFLIPSMLSSFVNNNIEEQNSITGRVIDEHKEGVPFAIIESEEYQFITDEEGFFSLLIEEEVIKDYTVSSVGYKTKSFTKQLIGVDNVLKLKRDDLKIEGVVIEEKSESATKFLKRVIDEIDFNFPMDTITYKIESRTIYKLDESDLIHTELNLITDFDGYSNQRAYLNRPNDQKSEVLNNNLVEIKNGKSEDLEKSSKNYRFIFYGAGFGGGRRDFMNEKRYTFLNKEKLGAFEVNYDFEKSTNEVVAIKIINEKPKHKNSGLALSPTFYDATVFINESDLAIVRVEIFTKSDKNKIWRAEETFPYAFKNEDEWESKMTIDFEKNQVTNKYFMSHAVFTDNYSYKNGGYTEWNITVTNEQ